MFITGSATSTGSFGQVETVGDLKVAIPSSGASGFRVDTSAEGHTELKLNNRTIFVNDDIIAIGEDTAPNDIAHQKGGGAGGRGSVYIGNEAGENVDNSDGGAANNTFIGNTAGQDVTSGEANTFLGAGAGSSVTTGKNNVIIGRSSNGETDIDNNIIIGQSAGTKVGANGTNADHNIIFGNGTVSLRGGNVDHNIIMGYRASRYLGDTQGSYNVTLGYEAASNVVTGSYNVAIGYQALEDAGGASSGGSHVTKNIAIGYRPLVKISGSSNCEHNVVLGTEAANNNGSGKNNIVMGYRVAYNNSGDLGQHNILMGTSVGNAINGGDYNVILGRQAGVRLTTASDNILLGQNAGYDKTTGNHIIAIGKNSGRGSGITLETNASSIFIGSEARSTTEGATNETVIGTNAIGKGSNTIVLGDDNVTDIYLSEDVGATVHIGKVSGSATSTGSFGHLLAENPLNGGVLELNGRSFSGTEPVGNILFTNRQNGNVLGKIVTRIPNFNTSGEMLFFTNNSEEDNPRLAMTIKANKNVEVNSGSLVVSGNISGSSTSTGSFGHVEATTIGGSIVTSALPNVTSLGTMTDVSGSATSTGSFGHLLAENPLNGGVLSLNGRSFSGTEPVGNILFTNRQNGNVLAKILARIPNFNTKGELLFFTNDADETNPRLAMTITSNKNLQIESGSVIANAANAKISGSSTSTGSFGNLNIASSGQSSILKRTNMVHNLGSTINLLDLHGSFQDSPTGLSGIGLGFHMTAEDNGNTGEMGRIQVDPMSGALGSGGSGFGVDMKFFIRSGGTFTEMMKFRGEDGKNQVIFDNATKISGSSTSTGSFGQGFFDGRVGIGAVNPDVSATALDQLVVGFPGVGGASTGTNHAGIVIGTGNTHVGRISFLDTPSSYGGAIDYHHAAGAGGVDVLGFFTDGFTRRLVLEGNKISGSSTSTGSFGALEIAGDTIKTDSGGRTTFTGDNAEVISIKSNNSNGSHIIFEEGATARGYVGIAGGILTSGGDNFGIRSEADLLFATNGNNTRMTIDSSGNVGINNTTPQRKLDVSNGASGIAAHFGGSISTSNGVIGGISFGYYESNNANYRKAGIIQEQIGDSHARGDLHLIVNTQGGQLSATAADARLTIDGLTGDVLFPVANQKISGSATSTGSFGSVFVKNQSNIQFGSINTRIRGDTSNNVITFMTNNTERVRINDDGVGIGGDPVASNGLTIHAVNPGLTLRSSNTTGACKLRFADTGDADIGMIEYGHSSNAMVFSTGDAEAFRLDTNQNAIFGGSKISGSAASTGSFGVMTVGGTYPGAYSLYVENDNEDVLQLYNRTDGLDVLISFQNPGGTIARVQGLDNGGLQFDVGNNSGGLHTDAMHINNSANVGIGTTSPGKKLVVETTTDFDGISVRDTNDVVRLFNGGGDDGYIQLLHGNAVKNQIHSNGNTYFTGGNVGIGDTSPDAILDVDNSASTTTTVMHLTDSGGTGTHTMLQLNNTGGSVSQFNINGNDLLINATADLILQNSGANVGIGDTSPSHPLDVAGVIRTTGTGVNSSVRLNNTTSSTGNEWQLYSYNSGDFSIYETSDRLYIKSNGNVGIGDTSPAQTLAVSGSSKGLFSVGLVGGGSRVTIGDTTMDSALHMRRSSNGAADVQVLQLGSSLYVGATSNVINTVIQSNTSVLTVGSSKVTSNVSVEPTVDASYNLGSMDKRWANIFSADLQLSNEGTEGNEVDGTTGSWTIQEGEDDLYLLNRKNGKKYKFKLEEIT